MALSLLTTLLAVPLAPGLRAALAQPARKGGAAGKVPIILESSPPGATVYVDGRDRGPVGTAGPNFEISLSRGEHAVALELPGYRAIDQKIVVSQRQRFTFALQVAGGRLEVRAPGTNRSAVGAEVLIDGTPVAQRVPVAVEATPGMHTIEVRKPGFRSYREVLDVRAGETATKWVTLQAQAGGGVLLVDADVKGAQVILDNQPRGSTPVRIEGLAEGDHRIEVRRAEGGQPLIQIVRTGTGQNQYMARFGGGGGASQGQFGALLVVGPSDGEVLVDGVVKGRVGQPITNLRPGQHSMEVRGKGIAGAARVIDITAGRQKVEQVEAVSELRGVGTLRLIMVNPVEGALYSINGRPYDEAAMLSDRGVEVAAGTNIVVVRKEGYGVQRRELTVRPGTIQEVRIDLQDSGLIQVFSEPRGAQIYLDNALVGPTPKVLEDVKPGPHKIELRVVGFQPYVEQVVVRGGEKPVVNAILVADAGQKPDPSATIRGLTSFSAVTIPSGHFTLDVGVGFPHFLNLRLNVGIAKYKGFGLDAGGEVRTNFYETDVGANFRAQLVRVGPIVIGGSLWLGGGGGPRRRNSFSFELGLPMTLVAGNLVKLTLRPYLQYYTDRLCPGEGELTQLRDNSDFATLLNLIQPEHIGDRCASSDDKTVAPTALARYGRNAIADAAGIDPNTRMAVPPSYDPSKTTLGADKTTVYTYQEAGTPVLDRFSGVRGMLQAVVEISLTTNGSIWAIIEGAPGQGARQQYTDKFNRVFPIDDFPLYGRIGYTAKF